MESVACTAPPIAYVMSDQSMRALLLVSLCPLLCANDLVGPDSIVPHQGRRGGGRRFYGHSVVSDPALAFFVGASSVRSTSGVHIHNFYPFAAHAVEAELTSLVAGAVMWPA